jgi:NAD(P)-dependent dehydrogenase (short-subunit alcohol dehydrogenase family)
MLALRDKKAFVTGGASGIGLALARAFAREGMNVMLADIEASALADAVDDLKKLGLRVQGVECDVADPASVERAAQAAFEAFSKVHLLCNNAGVAGGSGIETIPLETWRWVLDVNLMGVVHGISSFLPHMRAHREGGHIVNTASWAGLQAGLGFSPYAASKAAVVTLSEGLAQQLAGTGIGVTVLCPGFVRSRIGDSQRNRQRHYGPMHIPDAASPAGKLMAELTERVRGGLDPSGVAAQVLKAVVENRLYVFTHPELRAEFEDRALSIMAALDKS